MRGPRSSKINATGQIRAIGDVVNRNAVSVYQTDAVLILLIACNGARVERARRNSDETVQSTSMFKKMSLALLAGASCLRFDFIKPQRSTPRVRRTRVIYDQPAQPAPVRTAYAERSNMGGGFIEFLFGDGPQQPISSSRPTSRSQPGYGYGRGARCCRRWIRSNRCASRKKQRTGAASAFDPKYEKQLVDYHGKESAGTIVVDTPNKFLFLVQGDGKALRYGIGVGRPGFTWSGVKTISAKKEWPAWTPPPEMLARRPDLPRHMEGGPQNPLGARAMYLGSSLYRIHGSNEPWTIGTNVSSGCIRMRNEDVIDLYGRVGVGARVVVI
jgi:lipoprotein-anchoring transpeptidase ErfK/SrfK